MARAPGGGDVMSRTHATASACSYGMRYLATMIFNLSIDRDDDGNAAGGKPKSAYQARRENDYPRIEKGIREAQTFDELERVWLREQRVIHAMPSRWKEHLVDEKNRRKSELGGTMAALEASLTYLDKEGGL